MVSIYEITQILRLNKKETVVLTKQPSKLKCKLVTCVEIIKYYRFFYENKLEERKNTWISEQTVKYSVHIDVPK